MVICADCPGPDHRKNLPVIYDRRAALIAVSAVLLSKNQIHGRFYLPEQEAADRTRHESGQDRNSSGNDAKNSIFHDVLLS